MTRQLGIASLMAVAAATTIAACAAEVDVEDSSIEIEGMIFDPMPAEVVERKAAAAAPATPEASEMALAAKTLDELADDLRVAVYHDQQWYVQREPNYEAARRLLEPDGEGSQEPATIEGAMGDALRRARSDAKRDGASAQVTADDGGAPDQIPLIFGADNRVVPNASAWPHRAIVHMDGPQGDCTGTYIGPRTLLTAAHCIRNNFVTNWPHTFTPGRAGSSAPFGSHANCYYWFVPNGWMTSEDAAYDYAIVDFASCPTSIAQTGWLGIVINAPNNLLSATGVFGYPGAPCPGAPSGGTYQCGMYGSAFRNGGFIESTEIDTSKGQSGGPWFVWLNGSPYVAGPYRSPHVFYDFFQCGFDPCVRNWARAIDSAVFSFIQATSRDY